MGMFIEILIDSLELVILEVSTKPTVEKHASDWSVFCLISNTDTTMQLSGTVKKDFRAFSYLWRWGGTKGSKKDRLGGGTD